MNDLSFTDITAPRHGVDVSIRRDHSVLWITVDGVTVLRICQIPHLSMTISDETVTITPPDTQQRFSLGEKQGDT